MHVGDTLVVKLDALPGAGYTWAPTTTGRENLKFTQVQTLRAKSPAIGGKQTMLFRFLATAEGDATITLNYGRQWLLKKGEKPNKTMAIAVSVSG
jgi:predicted secreted protein